MLQYVLVKRTAVISLLLFTDVVCYCCCYFLYTHCLACCKNKHLARKNSCLFVLVVIVSSWQGEISELIFVYACVLLCRLEALLVSLIQIYHEEKQPCINTVSYCTNIL